MFRVKVMTRLNLLEKIEYFNNISSWEVHEGNLNLWRETPERTIRVATIAEWVWVKIDE